MNRFGTFENFERALSIMSKSDARALVTVDDDDMENVHSCGPVTVCDDSFAFAVDYKDKAFWDLLKNPAAQIMCCDKQSGDTVLVSGDVEIDMSDFGKAEYFGKKPEMVSTIGERLDSMAVCLLTRATAVIFDDGKIIKANLY